MLEINGVIKHHSWGGKYYLPFLIDKDFEGRRCSEYLLGAHGHVSATLVDGSPLSNWLSLDPDLRLGTQIKGQYGEQLPFGVKIIDVSVPQAIRVHPSSSNAKAGYAREISCGISYEARGYKDTAEKNILLYALSSFYILHGFKRSEEAIKELESYPQLVDFAKIYQKLGLGALLTTVLNMSSLQTQTALSGLLEHARMRHLNGEISQTDPLYWFVQYASRLKEQNKELEPGLILVFIMNLVRVPSDETIEVTAEVPYCFLRGQAIELSTGAESVFNAVGLSGNNNIKEFLRVVRTKNLKPYFIKGVVSEQPSISFTTLSGNLKISKYVLEEAKSFNVPQSDFPSIWFVYEGEIGLSSQMHYSYSGSAFYSKPSELTRLSTHSKAVIFQMTYSSCASE